MRRILRNLSYYIERINSGDSEAEEEFLSDYQDDALMIIRHDPYGDKIDSPGILVNQALQAFIDGIKNNQFTKSDQNEKNLRSIIIGHIKEAIHLQLKQLSQDVHLGTPGAEERLQEYEINILNIIERKGNKLCLPDHTGISRKIIEEFISYIKKKEVEEIKNFHSLLNTIIQRRMIDQHHREYGRIVPCSDNSSNDCPISLDDCPPRPEDGYNDPEEDLEEKNFQGIFTILPAFVQELEPLERWILDMSYFQEKTLKQIAEDLSVWKRTGVMAITQKINESFVFWKRKRALKKLFEMVKQNGPFITPGDQ